MDCENEWDQYAESKEECCEQMIKYGFEAKGCKAPPSIEEILNDKEMKSLSLSIFKEIIKVNGKYRSFSLKTQRLLDIEGWCQHKGWNQGINDSDCFLDSSLFALFGNDKLSVLATTEMDDIITTNPEFSNVSIIIYCLSLYAELLADTIKKKHDISRKNIVFKEYDLPIKQAAKWCLLWHMCQFMKQLKNKKKNRKFDSLYDDIVLNGIASTITTKNLDFDGGDSRDVFSILNLIFSVIEIPFVGRDSIIIEDLKSKTDVYKNIRETLLKITPDFRKIVTIPFASMAGSGGLPVARPYKDLFEPQNYRLEAIVKGNSRHVTGMTRCGDRWLVYDNLRSNTTESREFGIETNQIILERLRDSRATFTLLIYKLNKLSLSKQGGSYKKRRNTKKNKRKPKINSKKQKRF